MTTFFGDTHTTLLQTLEEFDLKIRYVDRRELTDDQRALKENVDLAKKYGLIPA